MKWYVRFIKNGTLCVRCFEDEEKQARHFSGLVNGCIFKDW